MPRLTETRAKNGSVPKAGQKFIWCSEIRGFACRVTAGNVRTYIVQLRHQGNSRRLTLGRVGTLPFEGPPDRPGAVDLARIALNAARRGDDPAIAIGRAAAPTSITLAQAWAAYERAGFPLLGNNGVGRLKQASSIKIDGYRWGKHVSQLGDRPVATLNDATVTRWLDTIRGLGARSQALTLLKAVLRFAGSRGLCIAPNIGLKPRPSRKVQNFLKPDELKRLDATLVKLIGEQPHRVIGYSAIRLMLHTGMRKGEVLALERDWADLEHAVIRLPRHKGSDEGRDVLLSAPAVAILESLPVIGSRYFFFGRKRGRHLHDIEAPFREALKRAGLRRIRPHDLRHSFASTAIGAGTSLYVVGQLLGHRDLKSTARYSHLSREAARAASDRVADALG